MQNAAQNIGYFLTPSNVLEGKAHILSILELHILDNLLLLGIILLISLIILVLIIG